nr:MmpS family transport accessory protein [Cryobacterium algoricola]
MTSDAGTAGSIRYMTFNSGSPGQEQTFDAPLPFTNKMTLEDGGSFSSSTVSLTAAASAEATTIACKITANGEVLAEQTSTGAYSVVACSGSSE